MEHGEVPKFMHPLAKDLVKKVMLRCAHYRLTDVAPAPAQLHDVFPQSASFETMPPIMGLILKRLQ